MGGLLASAPGQALRLTCELPSENGVHLSTDGSVDLKWGSGDGSIDPIYELQEAVPSAPSEFLTRYSGPDPSSVRTGLKAGIHRFRLRTIDADGSAGAWSEPLSVEVAYMPASRLKLLLLLGGTVVLATISAILHGHFSHRHDPAA